jgi:hypothetical protein
VPRGRASASTWMESTRQTPDDEQDPSILVVVIRSGGIAGMRRQWRAEPAGAEASEWRSLIDQCPWDDRAGAANRPKRGADRFEWLIRARDDDVSREASLGDDELDGAWRQLVDAVRDWGGAPRKITGRRDGSSSPA